MTDKIAITSELDALEADLRQVPAEIGGQLKKAVEVSARNIRDDWRDYAGGLKRAPLYANSITYDISVLNVFSIGGTRGTVQADIGPDKDRPQGALGNLIEYGSINNPPRLFGLNALSVNEKDFERGCELAARTAEALAGMNASGRAAVSAVLRGSAL